jgi:predicted ester cyclase
MSIQHNKAIVRRLFDEDLSGGNEQTAAEIIHPDFLDHTNPPGMQHGLDGHLAIVRLFRAAFVDQQWQVEDLFGEDDRVVARTTMTGTHLGDFFGIPPTGARVTFPGVHILRIADGRIAEHWGSNDDLGLMRQLGVIPDPNAVGAA